MKQHFVGVALVACMSFLGGCQDKSGPDFPVGAGSDTTPDARVFHDAPKSIERTCVNKMIDFPDNHTNEHLVIAVVCQSSSDAVSVDVKLVSGTDTTFITQTLMCAPTNGDPENNTLMSFPVTATQDFHATHITAPGFDIDCTGIAD